MEKETEQKYKLFMIICKSDVDMSTTMYRATSIQKIYKHLQAETDMNDEEWDNEWRSHYDYDIYDEAKIITIKSEDKIDESINFVEVTLYTGKLDAGKRVDDYLVGIEINRTIVFDDQEGNFKSIDSETISNIINALKPGPIEVSEAIYIGDTDDNFERDKKTYDHKEFIEYIKKIGF